MSGEPSNTKPAAWPKIRAWLKRLGIAGFIFFLLKGLLWLGLPGLLAYLGFSK